MEVRGYLVHVSVRLVPRVLVVEAQVLRMKVREVLKGRLVVNQLAAAGLPRDGRSRVTVHQTVQHHSRADGHQCHVGVVEDGGALAGQVLQRNIFECQPM